MRGKTYRVHLSPDERQRLEDIATKGVHPARRITRARILLLLDEGTDRNGKPVKVSEQSEIAERCRCATGLVYRVSKQYVEAGLEGVLNRKERETPPVPAKVTGAVEAGIIALSCSEPPAGYSRWTLRLLEDRSEAVVGIKLSHTAIASVLKKTPRKPH
jgi:transposase